MLKERDPQNFDPDESIGDLLGKVVGDARELAEAEIQLAKVKLLSEVGRYRMPAMLLGLAFLLGVAGTVTLFVTIGAALATLIGPLAGGLVSTVLAFAIAGLLAMVAKGKLEGGE
ncbi:phage holin family protein [Sphingomicrobium nitratireducens]|uniref:phage holin family protein n=1 Tax=Sphingomicrobium nitratireducens TaxID=2964666 RepID=UPI00224088FD|nr:phage holin family protein [Sphingomicrobium nitratireducens]